MESIKDLAAKIAKFYQDVDPYDYKDSVESRDLLIEELLNGLIRGDVDYIIDDLTFFIEDENPEEDIIEAKKILKEVEKYKRPI